MVYLQKQGEKGELPAALTFSLQGLLNIPLLIVMNLLVGLFGTIWVRPAVEIIMHPVSLGMYFRTWRRLRPADTGKS